MDISTLLLLLVSTLLGCSMATDRYWDYIVVGAGPSGLQMAYFLERAGRDYVVLEKSNTSGNFFTKYPRHKRLISINKRNTGKTNKEFNFRHDWNSLISDDESLQVRHYSREFFPSKDIYVDYLRDFERKLGLKVQHNTEVGNISRVWNASTDAYGFSMVDQHGNALTCRTLVMATGMWKPNIPTFGGSEYTEGYEDISVNPEDYEGQTVLILGRGNTAFEVADSIYGNTNVVHMIARSRVRLSWATHYVGDLRAVNNGLLDTYQLKSLDGVLEAPVEQAIIVKDGDKFRLELADQAEGPTDSDMFDNFALRDKYDRVIRCLGFTFDHSVFANSSITRGKGRLGKYIKIHFDHESVDFPGMFVIGTASHVLDHRKSAGGFIHGFRYTTRSVFHLLEWRNHQVPWPSIRQPTSQLLPTIIKRINEASGIYQMFNMLGDVIALRNNGQEFEYFEEYPVNELHNFAANTGVDVKGVIVLSLEYGADFSGPGNDIFRLDRATGEPDEAHTSNFLHPVFYYYKSLPTEQDMKQKSKREVLPRPNRMHHIVEDFITTWTAPISHIKPLRLFINDVLQEDTRTFFMEMCFQMALQHQSLPPDCRDNYLNGAGLAGLKNPHLGPQNIDLMMH